MAYVIKHQNNFFIIYDSETQNASQVYRCVAEPGTNIYTNKSAPLPPSFPELKPIIPESCPLSSEDVKRLIEESEEPPKITEAVAMPTEEEEDDEIIKVEEPYIPYVKERRARKPRAKKQAKPIICDDDDEIIDDEMIIEPEPEPEPKQEIIDDEIEYLVSDNEEFEEDEDTQRYIKEKERRKEEKQMLGDLAPDYEDEEDYIDEDDEDEEEEEQEQNNEYDEYDDEVISEEEDNGIEVNGWQKIIIEYEKEMDTLTTRK